MTTAADYDTLIEQVCKVAQEASDLAHNTWDATIVYEDEVVMRGEAYMSTHRYVRFCLYGEDGDLQAQVLCKPLKVVIPGLQLWDYCDNDGNLLFVAQLVPCILVGVLGL